MSGMSMRQQQSVLVSNAMVVLSRRSRHSLAMVLIGVWACVRSLSMISIKFLDSRTMRGPSEARSCKFLKIYRNCYKNNVYTYISICKYQLN